MKLIIVCVSLALASSHAAVVKREVDFEDDSYGGGSEHGGGSDHGNLAHGKGATSYQNVNIERQVAKPKTIKYEGRSFGGDDGGLESHGDFGLESFGGHEGAGLESLGSHQEGSESLGHQSHDGGFESHEGGFGGHDSFEDDETQLFGKTF